MYATKQNMIDRFGEQQLIDLTDRSAAGVIDDTVLNAALDDASAEMDTYFRAAGYRTPVATSLVALERVCCNLARYNLYPDAAPDQVEKLHTDAISWLGAVAKGKASIGAADDGSQPQREEGTIQIESGGNVFGRSADGSGNW